MCFVFFIKNKGDGFMSNFDIVKLDDFSKEIMHAFNSIDTKYEWVYVYICGCKTGDVISSDASLFVENDGKVKELFNMFLNGDSELEDAYVIDRCVDAVEQSTYNLLKTECLGMGNNYFELVFRVSRTGECEVMGTNRDVNNYEMFFQRRYEWIKNTFSELAELPYVYSSGKIMSRSNEIDSADTSDNLIVKKCGFEKSRYQNNHVKVLTNEEIMKYGKLISDVYEEELIPMVMTNLGDLFVYAPEDDLFGYLELGGYVDFYDDEMSTGLVHLGNVIFDTLYERRNNFNSELFGIELKKDEILYKMDDKNGDGNYTFVTLDMETAFRLKLDIN